jgi:hypothetical protein
MKKPDSIGRALSMVELVGTAPTSEGLSLVNLSTGFFRLKSFTSKKRKKRTNIF